MQEASMFDAVMLYLDFGHEPREKALNRASTELTRLHVFSLWSYEQLNIAHAFLRLIRLFLWLRIA